MSEAVDYFSNHALKFRFPWRLYHQPILDSLQRALGAMPVYALVSALIAANPSQELTAEYLLIARRPLTA